MNIKLHDVWSALYGELTLQEYEERIVPKVRFKDRVHDDVKKTFIVIYRLLLHGYFEYEFLDVAIVKCLQTFEMALKLRYEELSGVKWNPKSPLVQLIDWFESQSYFETTNPDYMQHVRTVR